MDISFHRPGPHLSDCVTTMVHFAGFTPSWQREKLLPDGAMEIVVDLTDRPKRLFRDETGAAGDDFRKAWISGVHGRSIVIEARPMAAMLVISFTPGGAYPFLGADADALADGVFGLADVLGPAAASLRDRVLEASTPAGMFASAEAWLLERSGGPACRHPLVRHLATRLETGGTTIADLIDGTGRSERHVQMLARRWLGAGLKHYARMRRFQRLLGAISPHSNWADLAYVHGYADQSHLGYEFRAFAGMTPGTYAARYSGIIDFLPIIAPADCGFLQDRTTAIPG